MHISFIPYGKRDLVEKFLRDMESHKTKVPMWKKDGSKGWELVESQIRLLPFGIYEYICAREERDIVLTTLGEAHHTDYLPPNFKYFGIEIDVMKILRMMTHSQPPPADYKKDQKFSWLRNDVDITIIGIKEDPDITVPDNSGTRDAGFTHEAV